MPSPVPGEEGRRSPSLINSGTSLTKNSSDGTPMNATTQRTGDGDPGEEHRCLCLSRLAQSVGTAVVPYRFFGLKAPNEAGPWKR